MADSAKSKIPTNAGVDRGRRHCGRFLFSKTVSAHLLCPARRIGRTRAIYVEMEAMRRVERGIAIPVFGVASTMARSLFVARRTYELPDLRITNPALGWCRGLSRRETAGRRRAGIVVHPVDQFRGLDLFANEIRRDETEPLPFINRNGRTVDAGPKAPLLEFGSPGLQIGSVG